jgi:Uma2 family endonuclease
MVISGGRNGAMALPDRPRKLTYDDYALLPDDGQRYEVIDGELYVTPAPYVPHQRLSLELGTRLHLFVRHHGLGEVLTAPCDVLLSEHDLVQPDLLFISKARAGIVTRKNIQGAPDLLIEILSESTRRKDGVIKRDRYERFGVPEYWIFNQFRKIVMVHRLEEGGSYCRMELFAAAGDILTTPLLPGFALPLAELFETAS